MPKKQLLCRLWSGTKHTSISKKYCRLFAIAEVLRENFTGVGTYLNMSAYSVKYISVNILNKILQMSVLKTGDYNKNKAVSSETAVLLLDSFSAVNSFTLAVSTLLQTWTEHFRSWYTEWQFFGQLLFQMFSSIRIHTDRNHDLALQSFEPARQKNVSQM